MRRAAFLALGFLLPPLQVQAELPGAGPVAVPESGPLEKDHQALRMRWAEKHLLPGAEKRWLGQAWAQEARAITLEGFKIWLAAQTPDEQTLTALLSKAKALVKSGCTEPLACLMIHKILFLPDKDWRVSNSSFTHCLKVIDDPAFPAALRAWIIDERIDLLKRHHRQVLETYQDAQAVRIADALQDPGYTPEFEAVLVRDFLDWMGNTDELKPESFELLKTTLENSGHADWVKETLLADLEIRWAWRIRGARWASMVKEDAWKGFAEHLEQASRHARKSWELRPDRPEAATRMLTIVMGLSGGPEKLREWFDRSVKAQFDYEPAYTHLANACSSRWGGGDMLVLTLGRRFAETRRYDTGVPSQLFQACKRIAVEQANARMVFSHPVVKDALVEFARGTLQHTPASPAAGVRQKNQAAISAWLAGDDVLAAEALKASGGKLDSATIEDLASLLQHESGMKTSIAAGSGEWGEAMKTMEQHLRRHDMKKALETLGGITPESLANDAARAYAAEVREVIGLPARLAKGGWHPLPVRPGLATCLCTGGDWRVSAPGEITLTGSDIYQADLAFPLLSSDVFEMRGEISLETPPDKDWLYHWAVSPMLRWQPERFAKPAVASGVRGLLYRASEKPPQMALAGKLYSKRVGEQEVPLRPVNTFHLKVNGPAVDFAFNSVAMPPQKTSDLRLEAPRGLVALAGIHIPMGGRVIFRKLEVRTSSQP